MFLNFSSSDLVVKSNVDLTSDGVLSLSGVNTQLGGPNTFNSMKSVSIDSEVSVAMEKTVLIQANNSVHAYKNISSGGSIILRANVDCVGTDSVVIGIDCTLTSPYVKILGGGVRLNGKIDVESGSLLFEEMCSVGNSLGVGGSNEFMALDNDFLGRIHSKTGSEITFKSQHGHVNVYDINQVSSALKKFGRNIFNF